MALALCKLWCLLGRVYHIVSEKTLVWIYRASGMVAVIRIIGIWSASLLEAMPSRHLGLGRGTLNCYRIWGSKPCIRHEGLKILPVSKREVSGHTWAWTSRIWLMASDDLPCLTSWKQADKQQAPSPSSYPPSAFQSRRRGWAMSRLLRYSFKK